MSGEDVKPVFYKNTLEGALNKLINEVGIVQLLTELINLKEPEDQDLIIEVLALLKDTGIYSDEKQDKEKTASRLNILAQNVLLIDVPDEEITWQEDSIDGVLIRDKEELKIIFSREKLLRANRNIAGDLLYQIMKHELLGAGMKVSWADYHAGRVRDSWNDISQNDEDVRNIIMDVRDPHRAGKLELTFEEILRGIAKDLKAAHKGKVTFDEIWDKFPQVLEERGWYEHGEVKERFKRMMGFLNKYNRDLFRKKYNTTAFGVKESTLSLQHLHTLATSMDKFHLQDEGLTEVTLPGLLEMVVLSNAQRYTIMQEVKKELLSDEGTTWEYLKTDITMLHVLEDNPFRAFGYFKSGNGAVAEIKAVYDFYNIDIDDFAGHILFEECGRMQKEQGLLIEYCDEILLNRLKKIIHNNIIDGAVSILIAGSVICEKHEDQKQKALKIDRFIHQVRDEIVFRLTCIDQDDYSHVKILKIYYPKDAKIINKLADGIDKFREQMNTTQQMEMIDFEMYPIVPSIYENRRYMPFIEKKPILLEKDVSSRDPRLEDVVNRGDFWGISAQDYAGYVGQLMEIVDAINQSNYVNIDQGNLGHFIVNPDNGNCTLVNFRYVQPLVGIEETKAKARLQNNRKGLILNILRIISGQGFARISPRYKNLFMSLFANRFAAEYADRAENVFSILLTAWEEDKDIAWLQDKLEDKTALGVVPSKLSLPISIFWWNKVRHIRPKRTSLSDIPEAIPVKPAENSEIHRGL